MEGFHLQQTKRNMLKKSVRKPGSTIFLSNRIGNWISNPYISYTIGYPIHTFPIRLDIQSDMKCAHWISNWMKLDRKVAFQAHSISNWVSNRVGNTWIGQPIFYPVGQENCTSIHLGSDMRLYIACCHTERKLFLILGTITQKDRSHRENNHG